MKRPRLTEEMRRALFAADAWGRLRMGDDEIVYIKRDKTPVCSAATALELCEQHLFTPHRWRGAFEFEITGEGRKLYAVAMRKVSKESSESAPTAFIAKGAAVRG